MSYFIVILIAQLILIFAVASFFVPYDIFNYEQWVSFLLHTLFLLVFILMILLPNSFLNKETEEQIKRLTRIREVYQRIVRDDEILRANPVTINNRIQQLALMLLRKETSDLTGDEKFDSMQELAE